eukprot:CAMPEP_0194040254 /NCGR_PEP_ID=MMETSP0009_2-20130614/12294_1 /TAXON_ID=210454 /ORGANISM="Grammatophora oceanica, Strain CCMP 410" /LENGTH=287 /DNA_ID=CAMNT_0038683345 /DNA_START=27 /DNA_END=890 /DNA_ORIENTATION=+
MSSSTKHRYEFLSQDEEEQQKKGNAADFWKRALGEEDDDAARRKQQATKSRHAQQQARGRRAGGGKKRQRRPWTELCWLLWLPLIRFYTPHLHGYPREANVQDANEATVQDYLAQSEEAISGTSRRLPKIRGPLLYFRVRLLALVVLGVGFVFWIWAIHNTKSMKEGQDLGMYSFATVVVSSHVVLWKTLRLPVGTPPMIGLRSVWTVSHTLVALNYGLGLWFSITMAQSGVYVRFAIYCFLGMCAWAAVGVGSWWLGLQLTLEEAMRLSEQEQESMSVAGLDADYF